MVTKPEATTPQATITHPLPIVITPPSKWRGAASNKNQDCFHLYLDHSYGSLPPFLRSARVYTHLRKGVTNSILFGVVNHISFCTSHFIRGYSYSIRLSGLLRKTIKKRFTFNSCTSHIPGGDAI